MAERVDESHLPEGCEVVKWHTRQKHEFIKQYLAVWTDNVGGVSGGQVPSLEIVDLFAGRGWCRVDPKAEPGAPREPWPGTAVLAARALQKYAYPKRLVLNSWVPSDPDRSSLQQETLRRAVASEVGDSPRFAVCFLGEEVLTALEQAARLIDVRYPTLWILDPYVPGSMPWAAVERIASLKHDYPTPDGGGVVTRRPEVLITLITEGLQRNIDRNPSVISRTLGLVEGDWRPLISELRDQGANVRQAILYLYSERLRSIYGTTPTVVEVAGSSGNIVYALVFCSSHHAGAYMARMRVAPQFQHWQLGSWKPTARLVSLNRSIARKEGRDATTQTSLDRFAAIQ